MVRQQSRYSSSTVSYTGSKQIVCNVAWKAFNKAVSWKDRKIDRTRARQVARQAVSKVAR